MRSILAVSFAACVFGALASPFDEATSDKYAGDHDEATKEAFKADFRELYVRHAEAKANPDAMRAWEIAHGGQPVNYDASFDTIPEVHGHYLQAREVEDAPIFEEESTDTSTDDDEVILTPRDAPSPDERGEDDFRTAVPDNSDLGVDTSLTGYDHDLITGSASLGGRMFDNPHHAIQHAAVHARGLPDFEEADVDTSLQGYDHEITAGYLHFSDKPSGAEHQAPESAPLHARSISIPDFGDEDIDTSLDGYDHHLLTRSVLGYEDPEVEDLPDFANEVDTLPESYKHLRARALAAAPDAPELREEDGEGVIDPELSERSEPSKYWTGVLPIGELHIPPKPTSNPFTEALGMHGIQHYAREAQARVKDAAENLRRTLLGLAN